VEKHFTILFAEDDSAVRNVVIRMLSEKGFSVLTANDGYEALNILRRRRVDVLFTDIIMPGMDGVQLATMAKTLQPGLRVLFCTGYVQRARERGTARHGNVLFKPFRQGDLMREVHSLLPD
jgi:two-component system, cell cycle response regulator CpdR